MPSDKPFGTSAYYVLKGCAAFGGFGLIMFLRLAFKFYMVLNIFA